MPNNHYSPAMSVATINGTSDMRGGAMIYGTYTGGAIGKTTTSFRILTGYVYVPGSASFDNAEINVTVFVGS